MAINDLNGTSVSTSLDTQMIPMLSMTTSKILVTLKIHRHLTRGQRQQN